jgi:hypothetical protein
MTEQTAERPYSYSEFTPAVQAWAEHGPADTVGWPTHVLHVGVHVYDLGRLTERATLLGWDRERILSDGDDWEEWAEPMRSDVTHVLLAYRFAADGSDTIDHARADHLVGTGVLVPMGSPGFDYQRGVLATVTALARFEDDEGMPTWRVPA